ncbi:MULTISPECIES: hypothetical protein [Methylomicrobium]|uniref:Uncharacterized protein n=1 Tax=Methylomicrobium album BG8 TaxID=686340 RepID=H8GPD1_METAL|nr:MULTISPECIES: hypothetical protein [Methylomicrobium]EIC30877.1 hypothetical protein Metal_3206 [Methylomicrobium album BG8]
MARINISVPDELKVSMDELDLNWSAIAKEAFETAVSIENLKRKHMNLEAGIERLKVSKKSNSERQRAEGFAQGEHWALESATYDDLKRIADLRPVAFWQPSEGAHSRLQRLSETLSLNLPGSANDAYCEGFIDGAAGIFDQVN